MLFRGMFQAAIESRAKGVHLNIDRYFFLVVSHEGTCIGIKSLKVAGSKEDDNDVVCIGNDKFGHGAARGNEGLVPRCLGTGPRNYGYRSNYYPAATVSRDTRTKALERKGNDHLERADSRSVLLAVDEIDETLFSPVARFAKRSPPPRAPRGRKLKIGRRAFEKGREREKGKVG